MLLEQEKQRNLEKQKEEIANVHKLQAQHREEQQRWEKERERQRIQIEALEAQVQQREEECRKWEEKLNEEKVELERQKEDYQQHLERLRETTKSVEKEREQNKLEKERLEKVQERFIKLRYNQIPGHSNYDDPVQVRSPIQSISLTCRVSIHQNETLLTSLTSLSTALGSPELPIIQGKHRERRG